MPPPKKSKQFTSFSDEHVTKLVNPSGFAPAESLSGAFFNASRAYANHWCFSIRSAVFCRDRIAVLPEVGFVSARSYVGALLRRDPYTALVAQDTRLAGMDSLFLIGSSFLLPPLDVLRTLENYPAMAGIFMTAPLRFPGDWDETKAGSVVAVQLRSVIPL